MRCLCSIHIFHETGPTSSRQQRHFGGVGEQQAPEGIHHALVRPIYSIPGRPSTNTSSGLDLYSASDPLPRYLSDPSKGTSYAVYVTSWQDAVGTTKSRWDWLQENISLADLRAGAKSGRGGRLAQGSPINGIERKPTEFADIATKTRRRLRKIWDCKIQVGLVEVVLPDSELK